MKTKTITVFAQICNRLLREPLLQISQEQIPVTDGRQGNAQKYNAWDLLTALIFCHLGRCSSLRAIEDGLFPAQQKLRHAKQAQYLKRSTLSYINNHTTSRTTTTYFSNTSVGNLIFASHETFRSQCFLWIPQLSLSVSRYSLGLTFAQQKVASNCIPLSVMRISCLKLSI